MLRSQHLDFICGRRSRTVSGHGLVSENFELAEKGNENTNPTVVRALTRVHATAQPAARSKVARSPIALLLKFSNLQAHGSCVCYSRNLTGTRPGAREEWDITRTRTRTRLWNVYQTLSNSTPCGKILCTTQLFTTNAANPRRSQDPFSRENRV